MSSPKRIFSDLIVQSWVRPTTVAAFVILLAVSAHAVLPGWLQHLAGASTTERALYRLMHLPAADVLYPRPPREAQGELATLIQATPAQADLYSLRARADEQALDFTAAEEDWKLYAAKASDAAGAQLELADYYHRRMQLPAELAVLLAAPPPTAADQYVDLTRQRSWQTFERILALCNDQAQAPCNIDQTFTLFLSRYPGQPAVYMAYLQSLLDRREYEKARALIVTYHLHLPDDAIFPIRAQAQIEARRGTPEQALAVYDQAFQPTWPAELIQAYFALLEQTHRQRAFVAEARSRLAMHPEGPAALNALARIFFYDQQAGRLAQAQQTLDAFRVGREARHVAWTTEDLDTLAMLTGSIHAYAEAARYDFALAATPGTLPSGEAAAQAGLAGLIDILLSAPEQPLALGAGNLTLYRDIATLDQGPGYWNGILSLWLNGTNPASEYSGETAKAQTYFHRSKAAELLTQLDTRFPKASERAPLHAALVHAQAQYGEPAAVVLAAKQFLSDFPNATQKFDVANALADAYAQQQDTRAEFALYDSLLATLAAKTGGHPLRAAESAMAAVSATKSVTQDVPVLSTPTHTVIPSPGEYGRVLDRYLGRLVATQQLPAALAVLRRELDRSPDDPMLYERLATFLEQNNLSAQQEQVFQQAIARFGEPTYYDKLARLYLREKKREAFATLTRQVVDIFSGTDLEKFFAVVTMTDAPTEPGPRLALQLNLYAAKRFPHDLVFTRNLLAAYQAKPTADSAAYEALLRQQWFVAEDLRDQFFAYLSRTNRLSAELVRLQSMGIATSGSTDNPAALEELAQLDVWTSHYEQSAPLFRALTMLYPANADVDDEAVSIFRSLSYLDGTSASLQQAVAIEQNLLTAVPDSADRLATLGDLYAGATAEAGEDLGAASPFWRRIPALHRGTPAGYLTAATIFWDYFQYDEALAQIRAARTRFDVPALYGYEAGAIEENRRHLPAAIAEYTAAAVHPTDRDPRMQLAFASLDASLKPPSDAADSNLQSNAQAFSRSDVAEERLVQLATRPATKAFVEAASAKALADNPTEPAVLMLRAAILTAQHREPEIASLLSTATARATTQEAAAAIGALAQQHNLTVVYEETIARQAALTPDPVQKIELEYSLVHSLESRKQTATASAIIAAVYQANPRILGVVRATTDFYGRTAQPPRAIATLLEAAKVATPQLAHDFTLEAATRANEAGDAAQARALGLQLLAQSPYDASILAVIAGSYARQNDNAGLRAFYLGQLDRARNDPALSFEGRRQDVALLRRGLIPALTRLNDFDGAESQYIALLSAFPEDAGTANEAALYALGHGRKQQLTGFLEETMTASPRDSRFAILLAQTQTMFEDLPAALTAYNAAIAIRKDRADLYQARADLEITLAAADSANLDKAAADFDRLYLLTYHDPQWQVRLAGVRVRQGRAADAVKALQMAYPATGANAVSNCFTLADQLAAWNLLAQARVFAEQGVRLAGSQLLTAHAAGAQSYARILTRLDKSAEALATLVAARRVALAAPLPKPDPDADASGDTGDTSSDVAKSDAADLQRNAIAQRRSVIDGAMSQAVRALGAAVQTYFTPEQNAALVATLDTLHTTDPSLALEVATAAGFVQREAMWRKQILLTGSLNMTGSLNNGDLQTYVTLEQHRLAFAEMAPVLEAYAARVKPDARAVILRQAAQAWRDAGDTTNELRVHRVLALGDDAVLRDRFFSLLLARDPAALSTLAAGKNESLADAAVTYTLAHGTLAQADAVIGSRGSALPPVWTAANTALAGLYLGQVGEPAPLTRTGFLMALHPDDPIGDRLGHPVDRKQTLAGDLWFSFASRFGLFLALNQNAAGNKTGLQAEDFLPAELELSPSSAPAYLHLGRSYAEAGDVAAAQAEYAHVLELAPAGPEALLAYDEQAVLLFDHGQHAEGLGAWRAALALLQHLEERNNFPERFYSGFAAVEKHLGERHQALPAETDAIVRPYLARNGNYRSNELLHAVYEGARTPAEGLNAMASMAASGTNPDLILADLEREPWLAPASRLGLLQARLDLARRAADTSATTEADASSSNDRASRVLALASRLVTAYLAAGDDGRAQALLDSIPSSEVAAAADRNLMTARLLLAAHAGKLAALLSGFHTNADTVPSTESLLHAAVALATAPASPASLANARLLREFIFTTQQQAHTLQPTDFLALAQARLATDDLPGALAVLRRLSLQPSRAANDLDPGAADDGGTADALTGGSVVDPTRNAASAAALLEAANHPIEALPFLEGITAAAPWNAGYRLRLGQAQQAAGKGEAAATLQMVANDAAASYATRAAAAQSLGALPLTAGDLSSAELTVLSRPKPTAPQVRRPFFVAARLALAATRAADSVLLLREAIALKPNGMAADRARLDLLIATSAQAPEAPALVRLLQQTATLVTANSPTSNETDGAASDDSVDAEAGNEVSRANTAVLPSIAATLDRPAQIRLASHLADIAEANEHDLADAAADVQLAITLDAANARPDPALARRLTRLQAQIDRDRRNRMRQPVILRELAAPSRVGPRVTVTSLATAAGPHPVPQTEAP